MQPHPPTFLPKNLTHPYILIFWFQNNKIMANRNHIIAISETASLAFHTTAMLAANPTRALTTRQLATAMGASEAHLAKILQRLVKARIISSQRGPKGGFRLAVDPSTTTLLKIYEATEGPLPATTCLLPRAVCDGRCILGGLLVALSQAFRNTLASTTLAEAARAFAHTPLGKEPGHGTDQVSGPELDVLDPRRHI